VARAKERLAIAKAAYEETSAFQTAGRNFNQVLMHAGQVCFFIESKDKVLLACFTAELSEGDATRTRKQRVARESLTTATLLF
jgi:hypothetical protein